MIRLYCKGNHKPDAVPCADCAALEQYAHARSENCPFGEGKTFCSNCKVHCYQPDMRGKIRQVMRYSGPRMMLHHPVLAVKHVIETKIEVRRKDLR